MVLPIVALSIWPLVMNDWHIRSMEKIKCTNTFQNPEKGHLNFKLPPFDLAGSYPFCPDSYSRILLFTVEEDIPDIGLKVSQPYLCLPCSSKMSCRAFNMEVLQDFVLVRFRPHGGTETFCGLAQRPAPTLGLVRPNSGFGSF